MSIVLQPNPNCIDRKQQLYSDLEILGKYTTQTCNSTFGNKTKLKLKKVWFVTMNQIIIWFKGLTKHHNEQIFGDQINCPYFLTVWSIWNSLTYWSLTKTTWIVWKCLKTDSTYCTFFDILSAGFHMISALHIGVR